MKRRTKVIALATSLLVGVSMIGVGFATWVIASQEQRTAEGNVQAETVVAGGITFKIGDVATADGQYNISTTINFGGKTSTSQQPDSWTLGSNGEWLTNDGMGEQLSVEIPLTFQGKLTSLSLAFTPSYGGGDVGDSGWNWTDATTTSNYITGPSYELTYGTSGLSSSDISVNSTSGVFTIKEGGVTFATETTLTLKVTFGWGSAFDGHNPYFYYNAKNISEAENAKTALEKLYKDLGSDKGTKYKFVFTAFGFANTSN